MYVSRRGHVGLGLVVVVVGDEVLDRVVREELAELAVQLRGERLVVRQHHASGAARAAITFAMVKVLPDPVTPSSVWCARPWLRPSTSFSIACG